MGLPHAIGTAAGTPTNPPTATGPSAAAHLLFSTTKMCGSLYSAAMLSDS